MPAMPAWSTRPYKRKTPSDKTLLDGELFIGRVAMVSSVALLSREVLTGASFMDQLKETATYFSM